MGYDVSNWVKSNWDVIVNFSQLDRNNIFELRNREILSLFNNTKIVELRGNFIFIEISENLLVLNSPKPFLYSKWASNHVLNTQKGNFQVQRIAVHLL